MHIDITSDAAISVTESSVCIGLMMSYPRPAHAGRVRWRFIRHRAVNITDCGLAQRRWPTRLPLFIKAAYCHTRVYANCPNPSVIHHFHLWHICTINYTFCQNGCKFEHRSCFVVESSKSMLLNILMVSIRKIVWWQDKSISWRRCRVMV